MTAFLITPDKLDEVKRAVAEARAHVIPWATMSEVAIDDRGKPTNTLMLNERPPGIERRPASIAVHFAGGITAAISFEEQPVGIIRHMSVGTGKPGQNRLAHPMVLAMLADAFGFRNFPPIEGRVWLEEYKPNYFAVNVAEVVVVHEAGHA